MTFRDFLADFTKFIIHVFMMCGNPIIENNRKIYELPETLHVQNK